MSSTALTLLVKAKRTEKGVVHLTLEDRRAQGQPLVQRHATALERD
jgi:hypothetical protein